MRSGKLDVAKKGERNLDEKVKNSVIIITADRGIAAEHKFSINFCRNRNVLANWQAQDILWVAQLETVSVKWGQV